MFQACDGQVRANATTVIGLDFGAIIAFAERIGIDGSLYLELLPDIETLIVRSHRREQQS